MTNYDLEEIKLLKWQFLLSSLFILSTFISLTLTYNQILKRKKEPPIYKEELNVLKFNRILASLIALGFVVINIRDKNIKLWFNDRDEKVANMQISASVFTLLATLIVLYIAFTDGIDFDSNLNPEL